MATVTVETPVGRLAVTERGGLITRVGWDEAPPGGGPDGEPSPLLAEAARQLAAYFDGTLRDFDLPLAPATGPHAAVFDAMRAIPYGRTRSYGEIAKDLGIRPDEVGQGCAANPMPVIVPCHRVLSATGLGGYSGGKGVETKIALLKLEGGYPFLL
jgi:methylated-DNA-[protein]-cysteine S-methyltransferase